MSRKRLKDMLRKEMDERIKTYDTKPAEKPSLKFDLKTDLLGKKPEPVEKTELKPILKETPKDVEEAPTVKEPVKEEENKFKKYLDEEDDYSSESESEDYSSSNEEEEDDYYRGKKVNEKHNFKKVEKSEDNKVKRDIDRRKEDDRKEERRRDDERRKEDERKTERKLDDRRRDYDDRRRDYDDRRRVDDRRRDYDDKRRVDDRRRDYDDRGKRDYDDRGRRDYDDRRRDEDEIKSEPKVLKGNQFSEIPKKHILQVIKSKDVDSISADCVDEMKDILQEFTTHMFELFAEGDKVVVAEREDIKSYISLFIEDEEKEMVEDLILSPKDVEKAVISIAEGYNVKIKKDIVYIVHTFLESILAKIITGAKMINDMSKTKRISGKELRTAYKIYML